VDLKPDEQAGGLIVYLSKYAFSRAGFSEVILSVRGMLRSTDMEKVREHTPL